MEYNIYCDESCHLENDSHKSMVMSAVWCARQDKNQLFERVKEIKLKHNLTSQFEIKWHKVSPSKLTFYRELITSELLTSRKLN